MHLRFCEKRTSLLRKEDYHFHFVCAIIYKSNCAYSRNRQRKQVRRVKKVLILEDEDSIRSFVVINLRRAGFEPVEAACGQEALDALRADPEIRVALLDVMLPDIDGFEVCRRIRAEDSRVGIIMLSARGQEMDKITGLVSGADDYVTKPFSTAELTARIDALYRRTGEEPTSPPRDELRQGPFVLNTRTRVLEKDGTRIKLTQTEYALIQRFMRNPGKALSREELLADVWGRDYDGDDKVVDVNIRRLRIKLEPDPTAPQYLHTVWGYGYQWDG